MSKVFRVAFAGSGDKLVVPETVQVDGSVSLPAGWGANYSKATGDPGYMPVGRTEMNGIINQITAGLIDLQTYGVPVWEALSGGWAVDARVYHSGTIYRNTSAGNTTTPPGSGWVVDVDLTPYLQKAGGTMTGFITLHANASSSMHPVTLQQLNAALGGQALPVGSLIPVAFNPGGSPPTGWLKCNGASVSRTTYSALYSAISTTYGSVDGNTFNLPDLRGCVLRGWTDGSSYDSGRVYGSTQADQNKSHNHGGATGGQSVDHTHSGTTSWNGDHSHHSGYEVPTRMADNDRGGDGSSFSLDNPTSFWTAVSGGHNHTMTTGGASAGHDHGIPSDGGSEVRMRNVAMTYLIKYI